MVTPRLRARRVFPVLAGLLVALPAAAADTLYLLGSRGNVVALDPATSAYRPAPGRVQTPAGVVTFAAGLGVQPGTGTVYGLMGVADACPRDPSRTLHADDEDFGCNGLGETDCLRAFETLSGTPVACAWLGGCEPCTDPGEQGCTDTCAEPPGCAGAPERTRFTGTGAASCAQYDGDATACGEAYFVGAAGPSTCHADGPLCLGCDLATAIAGGCTPGCTPPRPCLDPVRTLYAGPSFGCGRVGSDPAACGLAFTDSGPYGDAVFSCFSTHEGYCQTCTADAELGGYCTNACRPTSGCATEPERTLVGGCYERNGDPAACAAAYLHADDGDAACFSRPDGTCWPCLEYFERRGECVDPCSPAVCTDDPARTTAVAGEAGCHAFDGDPTGCGQAFYIGRCGAASCTYDGATASCRPCTVDDPGGCVDACGTFPVPPSRTAPSLVTFDPATNTATSIARAADHVSQPMPTADGTVYAVSEVTACYSENALFTVDAGDATLRLHDLLVIPPTGGAFALHPGSGLLYRLARDQSSFWMFAIDPLANITAMTPVSVVGVEFEDPAAMTWSDACNAFVVAGLYGRILLLDPITAVLTPTALFAPFEYDEGDMPVGILLEGATCPILTLPTTTTTSTSTSTTSSTSTTTLPSERLTGARLVMTDDTRRPQKRRLAVRSDDPSITLGSGPGGADDPTLHGGSLRVIATSHRFDVTYPLADGWRLAGKRGRTDGYKRKGAGPIRTVVLRAGRTLDIAGKGADLVQPLISDPGDVLVVLRLGGRQWCLAFGGTFDERTPKKLTARDAPAPAACPLP
jgi:hypothetical protein